MARKFEKDELNNIIIDYKNGMRIKDISKKYNRDTTTLIKKLQDINVYSNLNYHYTKDDIEFLKEYYPKGDFDAIFKRFPNANKQTICSICSVHKIKAEYYNRWTKEDLDIVKNNYYTKSIKEIYEMIDGRHSESAIKTKASKYL